MNQSHVELVLLLLLRGFLSVINPFLILLFYSVVLPSSLVDVLLGQHVFGLGRLVLHRVLLLQIDCACTLLITLRLVLVVLLRLSFNDYFCLSLFARIFSYFVLIFFIILLNYDALVLVLILTGDYFFIFYFLTLSWLFLFFGFLFLRLTVGIFLLSFHFLFTRFGGLIIITVIVIRRVLADTVNVIFIVSVVCVVHNRAQLAACV